MTPAGYLQSCRLRAGMSREDLALCLETEPHRVAAMVRAEWLGAIEDGVVDLTLSTALALNAVEMLGFDLDELAIHADGPMAIRFVVATDLTAPD